MLTFKYQNSSIVKCKTQPCIITAIRNRNPRDHFQFTFYSMMIFSSTFHYISIISYLICLRSYLGSLDWNWLDFNPKSLFSNDFGELKHCFWFSFTGLVLSRASNRLLASSWVLLEDEAASARLKRCGFCLLPVPGCCPTNGRTRAESWFKSRSLMPLVQLVAWLLGKPSSLSFLLPIILMAGFLK